jgi:CDP-6-deoxy-D-xylo-4-hexulose-3-dehydrase
MEIVNKHHLTLLEDCCDAIGSTYDDKPLGSFGRFSSASFYPAHHITMGEGGFVACNNEGDEKVVRSLREWGRGCYCVGKKANLSTKGSCGCRFKQWLPSLPGEVFDHKYVYETLGYNLKPIEAQCSMGLAQLDKLPEIHAKRRANYARLMEIFTPYEEFFHLHRATPKSNPSWFAFPITVRDGAPFNRYTFTQFMENNKIQTRNYFGGNLLLQPAYRHLDETHDAHTRFPVATKVTKDTLFLGTSPVITEEQMDYVAEEVHGAMHVLRQMGAK